jgi:hypothetical protein
LRKYVAFFFSVIYPTEKVLEEQEQFKPILPETVANKTYSEGRKKKCV